MAVRITARFLKYVWPFYNIMHERVKMQKKFSEKRKGSLLEGVPWQKKIISRKLKKSQVFLN